MDYELMMNGTVKIGQIAPDFTATTTMGEISLKDYKEKWVVLFSHPGDFTPVCTTEMIAFSRANSYFEKMNTCLVGLSIDSNPSHLAWMYDIYCKTGIIIPFPIIADRSGEIARKYGMISNNINNTATVRNVFIIDDKQIIRTILVYPMNIGRNISEILRIVKALQTADVNNQMAPANWMPCEPMIIPMPQTFQGLQSIINQIERERNGMSWYLSFKNPEICQMETNQNCDCLGHSSQRYNQTVNLNSRDGIYNLTANNRGGMFNLGANNDVFENRQYIQKENFIERIDDFKELNRNIDEKNKEEGMNRSVDNTSTNKTEGNLNRSLDNVVNNNSLNKVEKNQTRQVEKNFAKSTNKPSEKKNSTIQWKNFR